MTVIDFGAAVRGAVGDDMYHELFGSKYGEAAHTQWQAEDGWVIGYTTARIKRSRDGKYDGKFAAFTYKPTGPGAHSGNPAEWQMTYFRSFSKRKAAKARATALYFQHCRAAKARG